jgi:hypothetical protein
LESQILTVLSLDPEMTLVPSLLNMALQISSLWPFKVPKSFKFLSQIFNTLSAAPEIINESS